MLGEKRKRIARTSLEAAKLETRRVIAQIAAGRQHEEPLSLAETEDYQLAKERLAPFKISLLTAIEEWIAGRGKNSQVTGKTVAEVMEEFLTSKQVAGASVFHLKDRKYRMQKFAAVSPDRIDRISTHEFEIWMNGLGVSGRTRNNYRNAAEARLSFPSCALSGAALWPVR
jgi:hypothetical protein